MSPILGIYASQDYVRIPPSSYESIATVTASGGETSITFSSIPSTYKHLQIRGISRRNTTGGFTVGIQANGDAGSNYTVHSLRGTGSIASATATVPSTYATLATSSSASNSSGIFGVLIIDVQDYESTTKYKTFRSFGGFDSNGAGSVALTSGLWLNTSAINSLSLYGTGDAFAAGSVISLYGIKG